MPTPTAASANTNANADADALCAAVARLAARAGAPAYLVGGTVRDRLLGMPLTDLDIVIIGDAPALARRLADTMPARLTTHPRFGTATIAIPNTDTDTAAAIATIDLVTARRETYPRPGALPIVQPGSLQDDLARRDFTINAMALPITPDDDAGCPAGLPIVDFHNIVDPHHGRADLTAGVIRILHPQSFRDDPTRILRAARYAARFNFPLAEDTRPLLRQALADHALAAISGDRIRHELERTFNEPSPAAALRLADRWGILAAIHPALTASHLPDRNPISKSDSASPLTWLAMLAWPLPAPAARALAARLNAPAAWTRLLDDTARLAAILPSLARPGRPPSEICALLDGIAPPALAAGAALHPDTPAARIITRYRREWQPIAPRLNGSDLLNLGVPSGPAVGEALRALRRARQDGAAPTIEDERRLARQWTPAGPA